MSAHRIVLALGSNMGNSAEILRRAIEDITEFVDGAKTSSFYRSAPVGGPSQPDYLNAVLIGETDLAPEELLEKIQGIEIKHGRVRTVRWGPRTLDIDLVDFDSQSWHSPTLNLPHPRAQERAFVLLPWDEVDPEAVLIGHGSVKSLLAALDTEGVVLE